MKPLDPSQIKLRIKYPFPSGLPAEPQTEIVETSFFTPLRRPLPKIHLDHIRLSIKLCHPEVLFYCTRILSMAEVELVTSFLAQTYCLSSLHRISVHVVQHLDALDSSKAALDHLEQRASIVAEATVLRANRDSEEEGKTGASPSPNRENLLNQRESLQATLAQFDANILIFQNDDPAAADLLVPARNDIAARLRTVHAQLAALGAQLSPAAGSDSTSERDIPSTDFVQSGYYDSDAGNDEDDYRRAVQVELGHALLPSSFSNKDGYASDESDANTQKARRDGNFPVHRANANFIIDLHATPATSSRDRTEKDKTGSPELSLEAYANFEAAVSSLEALGTAHVDNHKRQVAPVGGQDANLRLLNSNDGSCSDLEVNASRKRQGRAKISEANTTPRT